MILFIYHRRRKVYNIGGQGLEFFGGGGGGGGERGMAREGQIPAGT